MKRNEEQWGEMKSVEEKDWPCVDVLLGIIATGGVIKRTISTTILADKYLGTSIIRLCC